MDKGGFYKTVADHMDAGFLENIIDMIRKDRNLLDLVPVLIGDERQRVRIGAVALAETFLEGNRDDLIALVPSIAAALENENPSVRADTVYILSLIGGNLAISYLKQKTSLDVNPMVRQAAIEAIGDIEGRN
ncbi:MAG: HEAT repeat domain-containing protein [Nitrospiraceae bacterium]|nr:HEAT repeat domain-containing protein [Nitrospiraceae bacterium]